MNSEEQDQLKRFAAELATESAKLIMSYFASPDLVIEKKSDLTPVTAADKGAEKRMREMIRSRYPEHGILGEEYGETNPGATYKWVLDPVDGTKSFAANNAQFGTLICLLRDGQPVIGAINLPATGQLLLGDCETTTLNGRSIQLPEPPPLSESLIVTTELDDPPSVHGEKGWNALRKSVRKLYTWGDCYGYYLVATGGVQAALDALMNPWDIIPLIPVMRGAGAAITGWHGEMPETASSCICAHPKLHAEILRLLNG